MPIEFLTMNPHVAAAVSKPSNANPQDILKAPSMTPSKHESLVQQLSAASRNRTMHLYEKHKANPCDEML
ncbi:UNVERIFIED_CONTAM: hypothetical protein HDU68_004942, partial [Siphonaria sp. JEL0065]